MKYYTYQDNEHPIGNGVTYIETEKGWTIRQITFNGERYFASNVNYPRWGMY